MKHFLTLALFACSLVGYTQMSVSFNPDYNGDGYVGVDDILGVLSHYDTPWEANTAENIVIDSLAQVIQSLQYQIDQMNEVCVIYGCTDIEACNYDVAANTDDESCLSLDMCGICGGGNDCVGCMDPISSWYDEGATVEGPCAYSVYITQLGFNNVVLHSLEDGSSYEVSFDVGWTGKLDVVPGCYSVFVDEGAPWEFSGVLINDELYTGGDSFCVEPVVYYPCSTPNWSLFDEGYTNNPSSGGFGSQWEIANSSLPNVYDSCTVVRWQQPAQLECFIQDSVVNCWSPNPEAVLLPIERLANISTLFSSWVAEYGLEAPSQECVFQLSNAFNRFSQQSCGSWTQTEDIGGIGGTASVTAPSNSGALLVRCGGIDKTFNVTIPSSYSHAFLQCGDLGNVSGINCVFNITYNPLTTVLVGTPSGIDVNYSFIENIPWQCGDPLEYQGYDYATVPIGEQCWFAENLRAENYRNGDSIPSGLSDSDWQNTTSGAVAVYGEDAGCDNLSPDIDACDPAQSLNEYGRLYNWYAVDDARALCPSGWHVPTDGEWTLMTDHLGGESIAGGHMKTTYGWSGGGNGTNASGFSGLPGGSRYGSGYFGDAVYSGSWWSSSPSGSDAWHRNLGNGSEFVYRYDYDLRGGFSVRCIQDVE